MFSITAQTCASMFSSRKGILLVSDLGHERESVSYLNINFPFLYTRVKSNLCMLNNIRCKQGGQDYYFKIILQLILKACRLFPQQNVYHKHSDRIFHTQIRLPTALFRFDCMTVVLWLRLLMHRLRVSYFVISAAPNAYELASTDKTIGLLLNYITVL